MKKVYVITEVNYGFICIECETIQDLKVFEDEDKALECFKEKVFYEINNNEDNFVLDEECNSEDIKIGDTIRFFRDEQENWDAYFEIKLEEVEISG